MKHIFTPSDFQHLFHTKHQEQFVLIANFANEKLQALIESWPVVYGTSYEGHICNNWYFDANETDIEDKVTHKARLAFVEEIVKEPCKHEPMRTVSFTVSVDQPGNEYYKHATKCQYCGVELEATWSEKK